MVEEAPDRSAFRRDLWQLITSSRGTMVEDRYLEDGAGRTSAQEHRTTLPQSSSLTPKRTAAPHSFLPVVGRVADRAVTSFHVASPSQTRPLLLGLFLSRNKGKRKKNRNHPRFRIQHVRRRRPNQVERQIFPFQIFSPSSSFGFHAFSCICSTLLTVSLKPASIGEEETLGFLSWRLWNGFSGWI